MEQYKFLVSGPVGAGKTTAIESACNNDIVHTDVKISDTAGLRKDNTTVAMDYGSTVLANGKKIHLYGTPGQERFDFMWEVLAKGTQGLILLFDNSRNYPQRDLATYLSAFSRLIADVPLIIGVTRVDIKDDPSIANYQQWLAEINIHAPVIAIDAREKADIVGLTEALAKLVESGVRNNPPSHVTQEPIDTLEESNIDSEAAEPEPTIEVVDSLAEAKAFQFTDELLDKITALKGVTNVMLSDTTGDILHSTVDDTEMTDFSALLSGLTPMLEESLSRGKINRIMLKSPSDDNVTVFIEDDKSLVISSQRKSSLLILTQQVKDVLQWS